MLEIDSTYKFIYKEIALSKYLLKDYQGAIDDCTKFLATEPEINSDDAYRLRGSCKFNLNDLNGALIDVNKAIDEYSKLKHFYWGLIQAYNLRAEIYHKLHKHKKAIKDYTKIIELVPNKAEAYYQRGLYFISIGKKRNACKDLYKSLELGFQDAQNLINDFCK